MICVSVSSALLMATRRATGSLKPMSGGGWRHSKPDPHRDFLIRQVSEKDDITTPELATELAEQGTVVARSSISRWLNRNGYSFKYAAGQPVIAARHKNARRQ